jgi:hypothetical protein
MTSFLLNLRFVGRGAASSRLRLIDNTVFNGDWNHSQNGCVIDTAVEFGLLWMLLSYLLFSLFRMSGSRFRTYNFDISYSSCLTQPSFLNTIHLTILLGAGFLERD